MDTKDGGLAGLQVLEKIDSLPLGDVPKADPDKTQQEQKKKKQRKFHPVIFAQVNPFLSYQKVIPATDDDVTIEKLNSPGIFAGERFAFSAELGAQLPVGKYLQWYGAISHQRQETTISYDQVSEEKPGIEGMGEVLSFNVTPATVTREYTYALRSNGLSTGFLYLIRGSKLQHKVGAGAFYMRGQREVNATDGLITTTSHYAGYQLHYRLEYLLTNRASIYLQPTFKRSVISPQMEGEPFSIKPYWAGVGVGFVYAF